MSFWLVKSILDSSGHSSEMIQLKIEKEKLKKRIENLEEESEKNKRPKSVIVKESRCFHSFNTNLTGYRELQKYGCICTKEDNGK